MTIDNKAAVAELRNAIKAIELWWRPYDIKQAPGLANLHRAVELLDPQTDVDDVLDAIRKQSRERRETVERLNASRDQH